MRVEIRAAQAIGSNQVVVEREGGNLGDLILTQGREGKETMEKFN
jgi:hypothetical protein